METLERTRDPSPLRVPSRKQLQPPSPIRSHPQSHSPGPAHSHGSMPHGSMPHGSMSHGGYEGMRLLGSADPRNGSFPEPARRSNEAPGQVRIASPVKTPSKWGGGSLSGGPASPVFTPPYPRESTASTSIDRRSRADSLGRMMLGSRATATAGGGQSPDLLHMRPNTAAAISVGIGRALPSVSWQSWYDKTKGRMKSAALNKTVTLMEEIAEAQGEVTVEMAACCCRILEDVLISKANPTAFDELMSKLMCEVMFGGYAERVVCANDGRVSWGALTRVFGWRVCVTAERGAGRRRFSCS